MRIKKLTHLLFLLFILSVAVPLKAEIQQQASASAPRTQERQLLLQQILVTSGGETEKTVLRLIPLKIGDAIDPVVLVETRKFLEATNIFESVDLYTARGDRIGSVILHVEAELARGFNLETGLGREAMQGWYLNVIGARYSSPFRRGGSIRLGLHVAYHLSGSYLEAEYPRLLGKNFDLLMDANHEVELWPITESDRTWNQEIKRGKFHMGLRRWSPIGAMATLWLGFSGAEPDRRMKDDADILEPELVGRLVPVPDGRDMYFDLRLDLSWDRMDETKPWREGWWAGFNLKTSSEVDGQFYWGTEVDAHVTFPIGDLHALGLRGRSAYASYNTPYHLRPIGGGMGNLRGYEIGSLSGPMGARGLVQGTVEWREPVLGRYKKVPDITTTIFLDLGDHWSDGPDPAGLSANVGYGMLIRIPWIQILNAEVAFPLTETPTDDSVTLNITLGRSF